MNELLVEGKLIAEPAWAKLVQAGTKMMRFKRCHIVGGVWHIDPYRPVFVGFDKCLISDADLSGWKSNRPFSQCHLVDCNLKRVVSGSFWRCVIAGCEVPALTEVHVSVAGGVGVLAAPVYERRRSYFTQCTFFDSWDEDQDWRPDMTLPEDYYTSNRRRSR